MFKSPYPAQAWSGSTHPDLQETSFHLALSFNSILAVPVQSKYLLVFISSLRLKILLLADARRILSPTYFFQSDLQLQIVPRTMFVIGNFAICICSWNSSSFTTITVNRSRYWKEMIFAAGDCVANNSPSRESRRRRGASKKIGFNYEFNDGFKDKCTVNLRFRYSAFWFAFSTPRKPWNRLQMIRFTRR